MGQVHTLPGPEWHLAQLVEVEEIEHPAGIQAASGFDGREGGPQRHPRDAERAPVRLFKAGSLRLCRAACRGRANESASACANEPDEPQLLGARSGDEPDSIPADVSLQPDDTSHVAHTGDAPTRLDAHQ